MLNRLFTILLVIVVLTLPEKDVDRAIGENFLNSSTPSTVTTRLTSYWVLVVRVMETLNSASYDVTFKKRYSRRPRDSLHYRSGLRPNAIIYRKKGCT